MMKTGRYILFLTFSMILFPTCSNKTEDWQPADYVNPFIGASTSAEAAGVYHGLGKTFPGATTPFGMVQVSPNTITGGDNGSGYSYEHESIEGFAMTQMSGVGWYGDLGNFLVMPTSGPLRTNAGTLRDPDSGYRSRYSKSTEKASAGYYSVLLSDYNITAEMTAAPHCGILRFTYPESKQSRIQIDLARRVGGTSVYQYVKVVNDQTIQGWIKCTPEGGGWGNGEGNADYTVYFYTQFSKPLENFGVWKAKIPDGKSRLRESVESNEYQQWIAEAEVNPGLKEAEGKHLGFFTEFKTKENEQVLMKTGISFVSMEGAMNNLQTEIDHWDFERVHREAVGLWNDALKKIRIEGGSPDQKAVFYTALYHAMIDPRLFQDVDGMYIRGDKNPGKTGYFTKRTIFSGWDVFRSQFPLQTIINPEIVNDMLNSLITLAEESNREYFERWEFLNAYSGCMIGNPAISVLADAYFKGIRNWDTLKAYQYAVNTAELYGNGEKNYTPEPLSISKTLEYSYTEWCLSLLARAFDRKEDMEKYMERSKSYMNLFDADHGWFRPKDEHGNFLPWPAEGRLKHWYGTIECNPYQQGWFVPHDIPGMVSLMGTREKVIGDLENFLAQVPENMMWNDYYNHANEPVHHVPFLFNRLGVPWLTQFWTREICSRAYHNTVYGLVGNEDAGQMSAWYVFSAAGLYPVCPGDNRYEITSPVFDKIIIRLDRSWYKGETFTIIAHNNSDTNRYIQYAELNGKKYDHCFIYHHDIISGGKLELYMGDKPEKSWGIQ